MSHTLSGLRQEGDCTPCMGGYYCPMVGMVTPYEQCQEGYYCRQYANISSPDQGQSQGQRSRGGEANVLTFKQRELMSKLFIHKFYFLNSVILILE